MKSRIWSQFEVVAERVSLNHRAQKRRSRLVDGSPTRQLAPILAKECLRAKCLVQSFTVSLSNLAKKKYKVGVFFRMCIQCVST